MNSHLCILRLSTLNCLYADVDAADGRTDDGRSDHTAPTLSREGGLEVMNCCLKWGNWLWKKNSASDFQLLLLFLTDSQHLHLQKIQMSVVYFWLIHCITSVGYLCCVVQMFEILQFLPPKWKKCSPYLDRPHLFYQQQFLAPFFLVFHRFLKVPFK